ncbi:MAG: hypothetical protein QM736_27595 [Vicinamibacterales bacterium]
MLLEPCCSFASTERVRTFLIGRSPGPARRLLFLLLLLPAPLLLVR